MKKKFNKNIVLGTISFVLILIIILLMCFYFMKDDSYFTVSFDTDGGNNLLSQVVENGEIVIMPENPVKEGYIFEGWYYGENSYDFYTIVSENFTLTAMWSLDISVINLNNNYSVVDYSSGTLCWSYSYPTNVLETYGIEIDGYYFSSTEEEILSAKYIDELIDLTEEEKNDFILSKWDEVSLMHDNLVYDEEKTKETYEELLTLALELPSIVVDYEVLLEDNKITFNYSYLEFSEDDVELFEKYNILILEFKEKIETILDEAFYSGGGCGDYEQPVILDESLCDKYTLSCDRW